MICILIQLNVYVGATINCWDITHITSMNDNHMESVDLITLSAMTR